MANPFVLSLCLAASLAPAYASAQTATPPPVVQAPIALPPQGQMGYYMMQGSRIVNPQPYSSAPACFKAVADLMKTLPANTAPIVCAHRRP
jgi:hypothetical protein